MASAVRDGSYAGTTLARRQIGGLTLAETDYPAGLQIAAHAHDSGLVALVTRGAMTEHRGRRAALCEEGTMIFQPPHEEHAHRFLEQGGGCFILQLGDPWAERMARLELAQPGAPLSVKGGRAIHLANELRREFRSTDTASELAVEGLALSLLGELSRARERTEKSAKPGWLMRAVEILHDRIAEPLQMAEIATEVGVHPVHLSRTFSRHYGCTMGEYLRRLRVEVARAGLVETDRPLSDIAYGAGFSDQAHFTRVFKKLIGITPGEYRALSRGR